MQLIGVTKLHRWKIVRRDYTHSRLQALVWKHTLATLGSGRSKRVPTVVESDICYARVGTERDESSKRKPTQRSATVHIILKFGYVTVRMRWGDGKECEY